MKLGGAGIFLGFKVTVWLGGSAEPLWIMRFRGKKLLLDRNLIAFPHRLGVLEHAAPRYGELPPPGARVFQIQPECLTGRKRTPFAMRSPATLHFDLRLPEMSEMPTMPNPVEDCHSVSRDSGSASDDAPSETY